MTNQHKGALIIIGGREDKVGEKVILSEVARRVGSGRLVITTVASNEPEGTYEQYERIFRRLGVEHLAKLEINMRQDAKQEGAVAKLSDATGIFFTGGDQLKITSQIGDTPVYSRMREIYQSGGVIAGTSAGASAMCETMLVGGEDDQSHRLKGNLDMTPGLGLIHGMIVDQHFAERGRMGRLLGAVAFNPKNLGVGIDENTAIVVDRGQKFFVLGEGGVYVVDGVDVTQSNLAEASPDATLSIFDVKLHVLSQGDTFDCKTRTPGRLSEQTLAKHLEKSS